MLYCLIVFCSVDILLINYLLINLDLYYLTVVNFLI